MKKMPVGASALAVTLSLTIASAESLNSPTETQLSPAMTTQERANLEFVLDWWREVIEGGHMDLTTKYQAEDYIQHNPNLPTGRAAFPLPGLHTELYFGHDLDDQKGPNDALQDKGYHYQLAFRKLF